MDANCFFRSARRGIAYPDFLFDGLESSPTIIEQLLVQSASAYVVLSPKRTGQFAVVIKSAIGKVRNPTNRPLTARETSGARSFMLPWS